MSCAYFVSDLHLKSPDEPNTRLFIRFLQNIETALRSGEGEKPTHLFLVGDIFDLWIGSHTYFRHRFAEVVEAIRRLVKGGVSVHFFEGNHDLHLETFWARDVGVQVHSDATDFELAGQVVRVEHGDLINPDDKGYLFLRGFLRSRVMTKLALNLPSSVVAAIGERASQSSRNYTSTAKSLPKDEIRQLIRKHAESAFIERPFDLLITGHVHVADDHSFTASGRQVRSVNLGSWYEPPRAFVLSESRAEFVSLV